MLIEVSYLLNATVVNRPGYLKKILTGQGGKSGRLPPPGQALPEASARGSVPFSGRRLLELRDRLSSGGAKLKEHLSSPAGLQEGRSVGSFRLGRIGWVGSVGRVDPSWECRQRTTLTT